MIECILVCRLSKVRNISLLILDRSHSQFVIDGNCVQEGLCTILSSAAVMTIPGSGGLAQSLMPWSKLNYKKVLKMG